jgi:hypothetical protein
MVCSYKKIRLSFSLTLALCSGIYVTNAMEQEEPALKRRKTEGQQEHLISCFENLPSELKAYIINFLVSEPTKQRAIESIKALSRTSKCFYNYINDPYVFDTLIKGIAQQPGISFGQVAIIEVAIAFKNPSALRWLKDYSEKNCEIKEILDQCLLDTAQTKRYRLIRFLLNAGADVNKTDNFGNTPLYEASCKGHKAIVELLLQRGANVNQADCNFRTPLYWAVCNGHKIIVKLLLNATKADVNKPDCYGYTLLNSACSKGNKEIVELLVNAGADVNKADDSYTPLNFASYCGYKEIVELLLQRGADVNKRDKHGKTPLWWAASEGYKEIVELLAKFGAVK